MGVFALQEFKKGDIITYYDGRKLKKCKTEYLYILESEEDVPVKDLEFMITHQDYIVNLRDSNTKEHLESVVMGKKILTEKNAFHDGYARQYDSF